MWQGADAYRIELAAFIGWQQRILAELAKRPGERSLPTEAEGKRLRPLLDIRAARLERLKPGSAL
jgi:hypothetical protein